MIVVIPEQKFKENVRTLVAPKDYVVADATGDESANLKQYANCVDMEGLNPPGKLVRLKTTVDKDDILSEDSIDKMEQKWIKGKTFLVYALGCVRALIEDVERHDGTQNVFIVLNKKAYKAYGKMIIARFESLFPDTDFTWIIDWKDLKKKKSLLDTNYKDKQYRVLEKRLNKLSKKNNVGL